MGLLLEGCGEGPVYLEDLILCESSVSSRGKLKFGLIALFKQAMFRRMKEPDELRTSF